MATKVKDLTGPGITDRYGVGGTDLGIPRLAPDGRLICIFGDSFERAGVGGPGWRSPLALFADPASVRGGLRWTGSAGPGEYAAQILPYIHNSWINGRWVSTVLPTDLITLGGSIYLHVMVCQSLGTVHWTELHRSDDNGETWHHTGTTWPGTHLDGLFQMPSFELGDDGFVYSFSTGFQRDRGLILQRVPAERFTQPNAWEGWGYRNGRWAWGNPLTLVLPGKWGELCLRKVQGKWLLAGFDAGQYRVDVRTLDSPTSDLTRAPVQTVATGCAWPEEDHARGKVAQLYGGYILPGSRLDDLHLVISQWKTDTDAVYKSMHFRTGTGGSAQQQLLL